MYQTIKQLYYGPVSRRCFVLLEVSINKSEVCLESFNQPIFTRKKKISKMLKLQSLKVESCLSVCIGMAAEKGDTQWECFFLVKCV